MRVALYWAPESDDALHEAGAIWFGRDPGTGASLRRPPVLAGVAGLEDATEAPAKYGLHATLRPPMRLATGWPELLAAAQAVARSTEPFDLPPLLLSIMDGALVLREEAPCPALHALADACVAATDRHRLPPRAEEIARRRIAGLSPLQEAMLARWGYPYVMQAWRFHVTLTRRLSEEEAEILRPAAARHFAAALPLSRRVRELCLFTQRDADAPFVIAERIGLGG